MMMIRRLIAVSLVALLLHTTGATLRAKTAGEKEAERVTKTRARVLRLGTGEAARVKVRLVGGKKIEGYISEAGAESFVVTDAETKDSTTIPYPQVGQVKRNNLKKSTWITIGVLAAVGVAVAAVLLKRCGNEGGC